MQYNTLKINFVSLGGQSVISTLLHQVVLKFLNQKPFSDITLLAVKVTVWSFRQTCDSIGKTDYNQYKLSGCQLFNVSDNGEENKEQGVRDMLCCSGCSSLG